MERPLQCLEKCDPKLSISNVQFCPPRQAKVGLRQVEGGWRDRERVRYWWYAVIGTNGGKRYWVAKMMDS